MNDPEEKEDRYQVIPWGSLRRIYDAEDNKIIAEGEEEDIQTEADILNEEE